jgi:hypothetical protein
VEHFSRCDVLMALFSGPLGAVSAARCSLAGAERVVLVREVAKRPPDAAALGQGAVVRPCFNRILGSANAGTTEFVVTEFCVGVSLLELARATSGPVSALSDTVIVRVARDMLAARAVLPPEMVWITEGGRLIFAEPGLLNWIRAAQELPAGAPSSTGSLSEIGRALLCQLRGLDPQAAGAAWTDVERAASASDRELAALLAQACSAQLLERRALSAPTDLVQLPHNEENTAFFRYLDEVTQLDVSGVLPSAPAPSPRLFGAISRRWLLIALIGLVILSATLALAAGHFSTLNGLLMTF